MQINIDLSNSEFKTIVEKPKRYNFFVGGRGYGRSYKVSRFNLIKMLKTKTRGAFMRYIRGDIRKSIYQEFLDSIDDLQLPENYVKINQNNLKISYGLSTFEGIGFKTGTGQQKSKLKSLAGYTDIIIEEGDELDENSFNQLDDSIRTKDAQITFLSNSLSVEHFVVKRFFDLIPSQYEGFFDYKLKKDVEKDCYLIKGNHKDNLHLPDFIHQKYEDYGNSESSNYNHYYYCTQILGLIPANRQGLIYSNWEIVDSYEFENEEKQIMGFDFGFEDETALILTEKVENNLFCKELIYQSKLTVSDIIQLFEELNISKSVPILGDVGGGGKTIMTELERLGYNIRPATKGAGSKLNGITKLQNMKIKIVDSPNLHREIKNYSWKQRSNGESTNIPNDGQDHLLDSLIYSQSEDQKKAFELDEKYLEFLN